MKAITQARLRIETPTRLISSSRNRICAQRPRRPILTTPFLPRYSPAQQLLTTIPQAGRSPNPFGSSDGDGDSAASQILDLAIPAAGVFVVVLLLGSFFGGASAVLGLPLIVTGIAAAVGFLDPLAAVLGTSPLVAAGVVGGSTLGILLIPAFLKFGLFAFAGLFVANLVFGGISFLGGNGGGGGFMDSSPREPEIDARNAIIDVDAETIDEN